MENNQELAPEEKPVRKIEVAPPRIGDRVLADLNWTDGMETDPVFKTKGRIQGETNTGYYVNIKGMGLKLITKKAVKIDYER